MTPIKNIEGFTPGPWIVEETENTLWVGTGKFGNTKVDDIVLALSVGHQYRSYYNERQSANATLIAYAPTMYALLKEQEKEIERLRRFVKSIAEWTDEQCSWKDAGVRARGSAQNLLNNL